MAYRVSYQLKKRRQCCLVIQKIKKILNLRDVENILGLVFFKLFNKKKLIKIEIGKFINYQID